MWMRMGVTLGVVIGLFAAAQSARASHCGAASYGCCPQPACDAQCCYPTASSQLRTTYKLVYDTVMEKRWVTCYQTVQETVMKNVTRTCYRDECQTCYKPCYQTCYKDCCY